MVCLVLEILEDEYIVEETLVELNTLTQQRKKNTLSFQTRAGGGKINRGDIETSLESFFFQNRLSTQIPSTGSWFQIMMLIMLIMLMMVLRKKNEKR